MPNWVQNTVKAENWETLKSVVTKLEQGKRVIDFNKVKPCPFDEELIEDGISDEKSKTLAFQTAWNMPDNIYREISKFTPIVVAYADENTGNNYGVVAYKDGQETVILDDKNSYFSVSIGSIPSTCCKSHIYILLVFSFLNFFKKFYKFSLL